jgi:hypothetical protein
MTGTLAEAAYHALEPRTSRPHSEYLRRRLADIGALEDGDTEHPRYPTMFDTPLREGLTGIGAEVVDALVQLGRPQAALENLTVGLTADDGWTAWYERKTDESGLVVISDSLVTLCSAYCEYEGRAIGRLMGDPMDSRWIRMLGRALLTRWIPIGEDYRLLAGILRYHNVTRRAYGIPAILNFAPRPVDEQGWNLDLGMRNLLLEYGLRFSVGHEAAHHDLGHGTPSDPPFEQRELDADTLALFTAAEIYAHDNSAADLDFLPERWRREAAEFHALLGALITMFALYTTERGLFVRRGHTHPPAETRGNRLLAEILSPERQGRLEGMIGRRDPRMTMRFQKERGMVVTYTRNMALATLAAIRFDDDAPAFDWTAFAASDRIEQPRNGHIAHIAELDRLMCSPPATLAHKFETRLDPEGIRLALAGDTTEALLAWGVAPTTVKKIHDGSGVLAFHTLVEAISATLPAGADRVRLAVAAATLVERQLVATDARRAGGTPSQSTP